MPLHVAVATRAFKRYSTYVGAPFDEAPAISVAGVVTRRVEGPRQWLSLPAGASAAPVVAALAAAYDVADLSIQEPDIEDVIRELYSRSPSG
jgi:ABC-2 type transport system ATP-binding protein